MNSDQVTVPKLVRPQEPLLRDFLDADDAQPYIALKEDAPLDKLSLVQVASYNNAVDTYKRHLKQWLLRLEIFYSTQDYVIRSSVDFFSII